MEVHQPLRVAAEGQVCQCWKHLWIRNCFLYFQLLDAKSDLCAPRSSGREQSDLQHEPVILYSVSVQLTADPCMSGLSWYASYLNINTTYKDCSLLKYESWRKEEEEDMIRDSFPHRHTRWASFMKHGISRESTLMHIAALNCIEWEHL